MTVPAGYRSVAVAMCTFRRPEPLARVLPLLREQAAALVPPAELVVVDNDPQASAREFLAGFPDVRYVHEPRPGIAAARNRALRETAGHDAVVFLDDDELPTPGWLATLVAAWRRDRPAAVAGPAVPIFETSPSPWVAGSGAFRRRSMASGTTVQGAATHNLLLDVATITRLGLRFDEGLGLTGGEDTVFTHTLAARGGEIRWCDEAEVLDPVPADRLTPRWVLRRTYRAGTSWSRMELGLAAPRRRWSTRAVLVAKAAVNTVAAAPPLLMATIRGDVGRQAATVCRIVGYAGLAAGAFGGGLQEYGRALPPERRRTVLVAHPGAELYGSDRVMLETAVGLQEAGFRVVVTVPSPGPLTVRLAELGVGTVSCPVPVLRKSALRPAGLLRLLALTARSLPAGRALLRREGVDVVVVNTVTVPSWLLLARLRPRRPTVCHVHEAERSAPAPVRRALAAPLALADVVVTNSRFSRDVLEASAPRIAARTEIVPNAVPGPPVVTPARERIDGPLRLLFVGRLSPRKGPDVAVAAVALLVREGVDVTLGLLGSVFAGYEWFAERLRETVEREGLTDRVEFLGFDDDVWPHLARCDVAVIPSTVDEPFGNTAVEALRAARPAVVSATSGLLEAADGYDAVVHVPPADPAALAAAVRTVHDGWDEFRAGALRDADEAARRHDPARYRARMAALVGGLLPPG